MYCNCSKEEKVLTDYKHFPFVMKMVPGPIINTVLEALLFTTGSSEFKCLNFFCQIEL